MDDCRDSFKVKITQKTDDHFVVCKNGHYEPTSVAPYMRISVIDPEDRYKDVINLLSILRTIKEPAKIKLPRFNEIVKELNLERNVDATVTFHNRIDKLQHKLESLKYHMKECIEQERKYEDKCKENYVNSITDVEEIDPVFVYETESFLFQTKSALDIVAQIIAIAYHLGQVVTYGNDGKDLVHKIRKSASYRKYPQQKEDLIKIIERNLVWIRDFVFMRDLITHFSNLVGAKSITHKAASNREDYADVYYPSMPNGQRTTAFMTNSWINLTKLIDDVSRNIAALYSKVS